ncbi:hypothetical protein RHMOL_RhmolMtG0006000 (mitochondrion) [Rhododendron molle]|nr:hypothetical protein RHMOL_RhmolMtG0006000 [Rhododendron molle]
MTTPVKVRKVNKRRRGISSFEGKKNLVPQLAYPGRTFRQYAVLGDDVVIADPLVAKRYEEALGLRLRGLVRSSSPTKPTTPFSSPDTRQSKSPPPCRSQSSDGTWNHTAAAALRARLLRLSLTYALAACPVRAIRLS